MRRFGEVPRHQRGRGGGVRLVFDRAAADLEDNRWNCADVLFAIPHAEVEEESRGELPLTTCYVAIMTKLLEQALRQIEHLTEDEQDAAAGAMLNYVKQMREVRLTEAEIAEIRRRRADPDRKLISHAEARERGAWLGS